MDLIAAAADPKVTLRLFLTGTHTGEGGIIEHGQLPNHTFGRRISRTDILNALDGYSPPSSRVDQGRDRTLFYVCGPPRFTDEFVDFARSQKGMSERRVLCEKWW